MSLRDEHQLCRDSARAGGELEALGRWTLETWQMGFWQRSGVSFKEPKVVFGFLQI